MATPQEQVPPKAEKPKAARAQGKGRKTTKAKKAAIRREGSLASLVLAATKGKRIVQYKEVLERVRPLAVKKYGGEAKLPARFAGMVWHALNSVGQPVKGKRGQYRIGGGNKKE